MLKGYTHKNGRYHYSLVTIWLKERLKMENKEFDLIIICGAPASGKMTIGQEIQKLTDYKLFYNHMSIKLVNQFFDFGTPNFNNLDKSIRFKIFDEIAKSEITGLIFTIVWAFNEKDDEEYINQLIDVFNIRKLKLCIVELNCSLEERLKRNRTENRLKNKPSKRDIEFSDKLLLNEEELYRTVSKDNEFPDKEIMKIDNTTLSARKVADMIIKRLKTK